LYQHPAIAEAAVIAVPDDSAGVRILAYLSSRVTERPSIVEMKVFCGRQLPSYMSPDALVFMDALPRTSTNKVDYQSLTDFACPGAARPLSREQAHA
jgi:acyl-coenzyme A synthetase/AMP-(fatty) acid ligase